MKGHRKKHYATSIMKIIIERTLFRFPYGLDPSRGATEHCPYTPEPHKNSNPKNISEHTDTHKTANTIGS